MLAIPSTLQTKFEEHLRNKTHSKQLARGVQKMAAILSGLLPEISFSSYT